MKIQSSLWFIVFLVVTNYTEAQIAPKPCREPKQKVIIQEQLRDPKTRESTRRSAQPRQLLQEEASAVFYPPEGKYILPVVFHVFGSEFNGETTVTLDLVKEALQQTNDDFEGRSSGYSETMTEFDGIKEPFRITFRLAQIDPNGNPTTGVVFYPPLEELDNLSLGLGHYSSPVERFAWDNERYVNVYILRDLYGDGDFYNSGVAWLPDQSDTDKGKARIVYNGSYLGTNTGENFRRILTHEFGHYLGLHHTFYDGCNADNEDDGVEDTPKKDNSNRKPIGSVNCMDEVMNVENFMDYSDYYRMFTRGQLVRATSEEIGLRHSARITLWQPGNLQNTGVNDGFNSGDAPRIFVSNVFVSEGLRNDGSVEDSIFFDIEKDVSFTQSSFAEGVHFSLSPELPEGLQATMEVLDDNRAKLIIRGSVSEHEQAQSIDPITLSFLTPAFQGDISKLYNQSIGLKLAFLDAYTETCTPSFSFGKFYSQIKAVAFKNIQTIHDPIDLRTFSDLSDEYVAIVKEGEVFNVQITTNMGSSGDSDPLTIAGWIDWDNNYFFDDSEKLLAHSFLVSDASDNGDYNWNYQITVPSNIAKDQRVKVTMRLMVVYNPKNKTPSACGGYDSGEIEDYGLIIESKTPSFAAEFSYSPREILLGTPVTFLDLSSTTASSAITQWQWVFENGVPSSYEGQNPPFVYFPEAGPHNVSLTVSNDLGQSHAKEIGLYSKLEYCEVPFGFNGYATIEQVQISDLNHQLSLEPTFDYEDFSDSHIVEVSRGLSYPLTITLNKRKSGIIDRHQLIAWADWNYNSLFEHSEMVVLHKLAVVDYDNNGQYVYNGDVTVPLNAKIDTVRFRILVNRVTSATDTNPCQHRESGKAIDYGMKIKTSDVLATVDFQANGTLVPTHPIDFVPEVATADPTTSVVAYDWDFTPATPASSSEENPGGIVYSEDGIYDVRLRVKDDNDRYFERVKKVKIDYEQNLCNTLFTFFDENPDNERISKVSVGTINHQTGNEGRGNYYDMHQANLYAGADRTLKVTTQKGAGAVLKVWIDWDYNTRFESSELIYHGGHARQEEEEKEFHIPFNIPSSASIGRKVAMRLLINYQPGYYYDINELEGNPCRDYSTGEVETYGLTINKLTDVMTASFAQQEYRVSEGHAVDMTINFNLLSGKTTPSHEILLPVNIVGANPQTAPAQDYFIFLDGEEVRFEDNTLSEQQLYIAIAPDESRTSWTHTVSIVAIHDQTNDDNEVLNLTLGNQEEVTLLGDAAFGSGAQVTITGHAENDGEKFVSISASTYTLQEAVVNDGSIVDSIMFDLSGNVTFTQTAFEEDVHFSFSDELPEGLQATMEVKSDKQVKLFFKGSAKMHEEAHSIEGLTLSFLPSAFQEDITHLPLYPQHYRLNISFIDAYNAVCTPDIRYYIYSRIKSVSFADVQASFEDDDRAYADFSEMDEYTAEVTIGETFNLKITGNIGESGSVDKLLFTGWIDWNGNNYFEEIEQLPIHYYLASDADANGDYVWNYQVDVPNRAGTSIGNKIIMRVVNAYNDFYVEGGELAPCGFYQSGEVEDYGLIINGVTTIINEVTTMDDSGVFLYPNPVEKYLYVRLSEGGSVSIYTLSGRHERAYRIMPGKESIPLNVSALPTGIYIVKLTDRKGQFAYYRVVKE